MDENWTDIIQALKEAEEEIKELKPHKKSDLSICGGSLVSKKQVLEILRSKRPLTVGDAVGHLSNVYKDDVFKVRMQDGTVRTVVDIHDNEIII